MLRWLMEAVAVSPVLELQVLATGMHLQEWQGTTLDSIVADGFRIDGVVEMFTDSNTPLANVEALGRGVGGVGTVLARLEPDVVVILGDRLEALSTAIAAHSLGIPVAHIHGGETTGGALDEGYRHAITKLSHLHFPCTEEYRTRIVRMGESPSRVHNVGALAVESVARVPVLTEQEMRGEVQLDLEDLIVFTYHPVTLESDFGVSGLLEILKALDEFPDVSVLMTNPNSDAGGAAIARLLKDYSSTRPQRVQLVSSLGQTRFINFLRRARAVVGNSSSTLLEAAVMGVPGVDIGARQRGRYRPATVEHCEADTPAVVAALSRAIAHSHKREAGAAAGGFGDGSTSQQIAGILASEALAKWPMKDFYENEKGQS